MLNVCVCRNVLLVAEEGASLNTVPPRVVVVPEQEKSIKFFFKKTSKSWSPEGETFVFFLWIFSLRNNNNPRRNSIK